MWRSGRSAGGGGVHRVQRTPPKTGDASGMRAFEKSKESKEWRYGGIGQTNRVVTPFSRRYIQERRRYGQSQDFHRFEPPA